MTAFVDSKEHSISTAMQREQDKQQSLLTIDHFIENGKLSISDIEEYVARYHGIAGYLSRATRFVYGNDVFLPYPIASLIASYLPDKTFLSQIGPETLNEKLIFGPNIGFLQMSDDVPSVELLAYDGMATKSWEYKKLEPYHVPLNWIKFQIYNMKRAKVFISFWIKFVEKVPKPPFRESGVKIHMPQNGIVVWRNEWIQQCQTDKWTQIQLEQEVMGIGNGHYLLMFDSIKGPQTIRIVDFNIDVCSEDVRRGTQQVVAPKEDFGLFE